MQRRPSPSPAKICPELSLRAYDGILKVTRTIAELDGDESVSIPHISGEILCHSLERNFTM